MPKNIIICCDGTGNEIKENQSNVLKLFRLIKKHSDNKSASDSDFVHQICYYDPGVGTISDDNPFAGFGTSIKRALGLVTGHGLDQNVLEAYKFLMDNFEPGDKLFFFGSSRGAYTVRVLAGFILMVGIMRPQQWNLIGYAFVAYKKAKHSNSHAFHFNRVLETHRPVINFIGCWDTVGTLLVPRADRLGIPALEELSYTCENKSVACFRQALAIDEQRTMYEPLHWKIGQKHTKSPYLPIEKGEEQDFKEMWFAGSHGDIGGGAPEHKSCLSKIPLKWMVDEAVEKGLIIREPLYKRLVLGLNPKNPHIVYSKPNPCAAVTKSMTLGWHFAEYLPLRPLFLRKGMASGVVSPGGRQRFISNHAHLHESVIERLDSMSDYRPKNLRHHPYSKYFY